MPYVTVKNSNAISSDGSKMNRISKSNCVAYVLQLYISINVSLIVLGTLREQVVSKKDYYEMPGIQFNPNRIFIHEKKGASSLFN